MTSSFSPTAIGELLRRHYPRAEGVLKAMLEAIMFTRTQGTKLNEFDIINRVIPLRSKVKVLDDETNAQLDVSSGYPTYIPATEPNGDTVKLYLFLDHIADSYKDHSGFGNHASIYFENSMPEVDVDGPDLGNGHASRALRFDSTKNMGVQVPDHSSIRIAGLTVGFSLVMRVRLFSLANEGGTMRRLYIKRDDANNSIIIGVDSTGKIEVHIEIGGVTTRWETTNTEISINTWYKIGIKFNVTGPAMTIYVDGVSKPVTSGISSRTITDSTANLILGAFDVGEHKIFNGTSDVTIQSHSAALNLLQFSIAGTFRTTQRLVGAQFAYILSKGKFTVETAGQNLNYFVGMFKGGKLSAGFETSAGVNNIINSPLGYNDDVIHNVVITYDQVTLKMYVDTVLVASLATTATPDTNSLSLYVGAGDPGTVNFWAGLLDDLRVWNNDLTAGEVAAYPGTIPQTGNIVYEENYGGDGLNSGGNLDGNIQWVMFDRDILYSDTEMLAIHNNKWTKNSAVGSNKVSQVFFTLATTP